jgi:hypothetical protein
MDAYDIGETLRRFLKRRKPPGLVVFSFEDYETAVAPNNSLKRPEAVRRAPSSGFWFQAVFFFGW